MVSQNAPAQQQSPSFRVEKVGRRHYIVGDTYAARHRLSQAGCTFDPERGRGQWWTGKAELAERLVGELSSKPASTGVGLEDRVIVGRAQYKGQGFYVLWAGNRKSDGRPAAKLCSRDGKLVFWAADGEPVEVQRRYQSPRSIAELRAFAEQRRAVQSGEAECPVCAQRCTCAEGFCLHHHDGCDYCGAER